MVGFVKKMVIYIDSKNYLNFKMGVYYLNRINLNTLNYYLNFYFINFKQDLNLNFRNYIRF